MDGNAAQIIFLARIFPWQRFLHIARLPTPAVVRARVNLAIDDDEDCLWRPCGHGDVVNVTAAGHFDDFPCLAAVAAVARTVHFETGPDMIRFHWVHGDAGETRRADRFALCRHFHGTLVPGSAAIL